MRIKTNTTWSSLVALFSVHKLSYEEARKRLLFGVFCIVSSVMLMIFAAHHLARGEFVEGLLNSLASLILIGSLVLARRHSDARSFYRIPVIVIGLLFVYFATLSDPSGYRMLWLYAYPPMVLFLVGAREGMIYVAVLTVVWVAALLVPTSISGPAIYEPAMTLRFLASFGLVISASWFLEAVRGFYAESERTHNIQLEHDHRQMHDLAYSDELTQLPNRRSAQHMIDDTLAALSFDDSKTALIAMLDIDRFKVINDHFGHPVGDQVLRSVAKRVRNAIRKNDFVGRYGGEEFLLVIPGAHKEQYQVILEKIRLAVCKRPINLEGVLHHVTVSIGGTDGLNEIGRDAIIEQADQALYVAKQSGRNQCKLYQSGRAQNDATVTIAS